MSFPLFLHGGGDDPAANAAALGPFVSTVAAHSAGPLALVFVRQKDETDDAYVAYYGQLFAGLGLPAERQAFIAVSPYGPLARAELAAIKPAGLFVCGGVTPHYIEALTGLSNWVSYLREHAVPYCGSSAGAAIAATQAIVGGWRAARGGAERQILFQGASEGLQALTVLPGLGLLPGAVDVHASQWGTLSRLVQAVDLGLVPTGVAIDENTCLVVTGSSGRVVGAGHVYHTVAQPGGVALTVHVAGDVLPVGPQDGAA